MFFVKKGMDTSLAFLCCCCCFLIWDLGGERGEGKKKKIQKRKGKIVQYLGLGSKVQYLGS